MSCEKLCWLVDCSTVGLLFSQGGNNIEYGHHSKADLSSEQMFNNHVLIRCIGLSVGLFLETTSMFGYTLGKSVCLPRSSTDRQSCSRGLVELAIDFSERTIMSKVSDIDYEDSTILR